MYGAKRKLNLIKILKYFFHSIVIHHASDSNSLVNIFKNERVGICGCASATMCVSDILLKVLSFRTLTPCKGKDDVDRLRHKTIWNYIHCLSIVNLLLSLDRWALLLIILQWLLDVCSYFHGTAPWKSGLIHNFWIKTDDIISLSFLPVRKVGVKSEGIPKQADCLTFTIFVCQDHLNFV